MYRWMAFFLIALRLAIGWHFLVEGWLKVQSTYLVGPTFTNKPFSSAGYFREAPGPLGQAVRRYEGDPDDHALARLLVLPKSNEEDAAPARDRMPPGLKRDWEEYVDRFIAHYQLSDTQATDAREYLAKVEAQTVDWLTYIPPADVAAARENDKRYAAMTTEQTRTFPTGDVKRRMSMAERVGEYRAKLADLRDTVGNKLWDFGKDVEGARLRTRKQEVAQLRTGLLDTLDEQTKKLKDELDKTLTPEQKAEGPVTAPQRKNVIDYVDLVTPFVLCAVGIGLLVGLFSRLSALLGAGFLLMTYLAVPALPWLPAAGPSEGNYLFVNKNLIEMLALLVLASVPTGRWFGLDALLYSMGATMFRKRPVAQTQVQTRA